MTTPPPHLLVVEDDPQMRDLMRKVLVRDGYDVREAEDGLAAKGILADEHFDLVITDLLMPNDGGLSLLGHVSRACPETPVIIVTAFGDWDTYAQALARGASAFISKPLRLAELRAAVRTALAAREAPASS